MNSFLKVISFAALCLLAGCAGVNSSRVNHKIEQPSSHTKGLSALYRRPVATAEVCTLLRNHVIAMNERGEYKPVGFTNDQCKTEQIPEGERPHFGRDNVMEQDMGRIFQTMKDTNPNPEVPPRLLIFIHGGLNSYRMALDRVERDADKMMQDGYYPVFVIWPSWIDTYPDSVGNFYQGDWDHVGYSWTAPFKFATDLVQIGAQSVWNYSKQINLWAGSSCLSEAYRGWFPLYCGDNLQHGQFRASDPYNDPCQRGDHVRGFTCKETDADTAAEFDTGRLATFVATPLKAATIPLVPPIGERAWKSMLSRTRFAFRRPCPTDSAGSGDCSHGVVWNFFHGLEKAFGKEEIDITLIGHSMGSIVASEVINEFSSLPYRNVIFLGAAVSVREFRNSVEQVIRQRFEHLSDEQRSVASKSPPCPKTQPPMIAETGLPEPFCFFNVSLHPYAEAREENLASAAPSGSLLEWIDNNFENPVDPSDRTLGRWANVTPLQTTFDQKLLGSYTHFKRLGLDRASPRSHAELADPQHGGRYWDPAYWQ